MMARNAIITGARSGIGLATLRLFAKNDINCWAVVHRRDEDFEEEVECLAKDNGVWIKPVFMDLSHSESISEGFKTIIQDKQPIDILVNAAGIVSPNRLFTMTKMDDIRNVMEVNFFCVIQMSQLTSRQMMRQKKGVIVNVASISAWGEDTSQMEYAASKSAVVIATKKIARELGVYGIRVNAVAPGLTETKMLDGMETEAISDIMKGTALHRLGKTEEIAEVIYFLTSDASGFITGQTIKVDGGGYDLRAYFNSKTN